MGDPSELSLTGRHWLWPEPLVETDEEAGLPPWLRGLLHRREIRGDAVAQHLKPTLASLDDPMLMADMPQAVDRIIHAIRNDEAIMVYGDYDVDGVSSTTVMVDFLQRVGGKVDFYIPDRQTEGYGLNAAAVESFASHCKVLITTDCGITAHEEIALARDRGVDVIIVDHHQVSGELPPAHACLDPQRSDCAYPFKDLCATGVAFMLVGALRRCMRDAGFFNHRPEPDVRDLLDIVATATVADMVPILGPNRALVSAGLRVLGQTQRLGMRALMNVSEIDPHRIDASDLGFRIGPRINARGRLQHAKGAVELLLTGDAQQAMQLAQALDAANKERRKIEAQTVAAAIEQVQEQQLDAMPGLVVYHPDWHPGVLGLVASRLVSRFHRPTVVIGQNGKGSGRTFEKVNLYEAMASGRQWLDKFGGHPAAAGLTMGIDRIDRFRQDFCDAISTQIGAPPYAATLRPDVEIDAQSLAIEMVDDLTRLAPFGQANPEPLLVSRGVKVAEKRVVGSSHLKMRLGPQLDAIAFGMADLLDSVPDSVDAAFHLERNVFRGRTTMQLRVRDLRPS